MIPSKRRCCLFGVVHIIVDLLRSLRLGVAALILGLVAFGGGTAQRPGVVPSQAGSPTPIHPSGSITKGTWRLLDDSLNGNWLQNTSGPPVGYLACPAVSTCYGMSGHYASAMAGAPLLSVSLYASNDVGTTWSEFSIRRALSYQSSFLWRFAQLLGRRHLQREVDLDLDGGRRPLVHCPPTAIRSRELVLIGLHLNRQVFWTRCLQHLSGGSQ